MIRGFLSFFILLSIASATAQTPSSARRQTDRSDPRGSARGRGGAQLDAFASVTESGSVNQNGGPPDSFEAVADLRNGYSRVKGVAGPATLLQGYDGRPMERNERFALDRQPAVARCRRGDASLLDEQCVL
jgi:hypothetical protein